MKCNKCDMNVDLKWNFCPNCKDEIRKIELSAFDNLDIKPLKGFCQNCAFELENNWNFCPRCSDSINFYENSTKKTDEVKNDLKHDTGVIVDSNIEEIQVVDSDKINESLNNNERKETVKGESFLGKIFRFLVVITSFPINIIMCLILSLIVSLVILSLFGPLGFLFFAPIFSGVLNVMNVVFGILWIINFIVSIIQTFVKKSSDQFWKNCFYINLCGFVLAIIFLIFR